jgi:hypothetical protein
MCQPLRVYTCHIIKKIKNKKSLKINYKIKKIIKLNKIIKNLKKKKKKSGWLTHPHDQFGVTLKIIIEFQINCY